jgi:small subunit ribosomal protein S1
MAAEKVEDATTKFKVGDSVEAKVMGTDRKTHMITLSIKAKDAKTPAKKTASKTTKAAKGEGTTTTTGKKKKESGLKTTLGDLFNMNNEKEDEG